MDTGKSLRKTGISRLGEIPPCPHNAKRFSFCAPAQIGNIFFFLDASQKEKAS